LLEPEFDVVGVVTDGRALIEAAGELRPHIVILDIAMPHLNGLDAGENIKQKNGSIKLVFLTMDTSPDLAAEAFRRGASGYVLKQCSGDELLIAVRRVLRGQSYLPPLITKQTVEFLLRSGATYRQEKHISGRQREVLQLLAEGRSMKEIAYTLGVKPGTVAFHKYRTMEALGLKSNAELVGYAIRHHILAS
jgi:DNA-binding NarL/FixJ family response regulator